MSRHCTETNFVYKIYIITVMKKGNECGIIFGLVLSLTLFKEGHF